MISTSYSVFFRERLSSLFETNGSQIIFVLYAIAVLFCLQVFFRKVYQRFLIVILISLVLDGAAEIMYLSSRGWGNDDLKLLFQPSYLVWVFLIANLIIVAAYSILVARWKQPDETQ